MHRILTGVLALLALYFAGDHARLQNRNRFLEEKLAEKPAPPPRSVPSVVVQERIVYLPAPEPAPPPPARAEKTARASEQWIDADVPAKTLLGLMRRIPEQAVENYRRLPAAELELGLVDPTQVLVPDAVEVLPTAGPRGGFLGISGSQAEGGGVIFSEIIADSAASRAGLLVGDTLIEFNDQKLADYGALVAIVRELPEGSPVNLKIRRNGLEFTQAVVLGRR